ncbi:MAG TPA: beta-ketoacyl synthase N-terminal-like domain-containing protein, partial [Candidatus Omnitrophota bacterium]|nr:beta-ketoacyl synthase N-terminal-like domain-containing protein [Candidatus Omnitrophota bacterium]
MEKRRVVITGLGIISPVGSGTQKFWKALLAGQSGIGPITRFDASQFDCRIAGEVKDFNPLDHFSTKEARNLAPFVQYAAVTSDEAIK